jgi:hypothetical protein
MLIMTVVRSSHRRSMIPSLRRSRASCMRAPNIYDVAREAKVSVFTVSAVIDAPGHSSTL